MTVSLLLTALFLTPSAWAEPYLAIKSGQACSTCHVAPTGGGLRTDFGQFFGRSLAQDQTLLSELSGSINQHLTLGADMRASLQFNQPQNAANQSKFQSDRTSVYVLANIIPNKISFYVDQQFAPANENRTAWVKWQSDDLNYYGRLGQFYLPYGLRLEDDSAFIRQVTGINFSAADNGIELGIYHGSWQTQLAFSNGTQGSAEIDTDKQLSVRSVYIQPTWRVGASFNQNKGNGTTRKMMNIFGGFQAYDSQILLEFDVINDASDSKDITQHVMLAEVNKEVQKGHNVKYTYEYHDADTAINENQRIRQSIVWEYSPYQQFQIRSGLRVNDGIPQKDVDNSELLFISAHMWF